MAETLHHIGHRKRLRDKLLASKVGSLPDYEILETVLTLAKPRGDVKPLAKTLLNKYGSLARLLNTEPDILKKEPDVGDSVVAAFRIVKEAAFRLIGEDVKEATIIESWKSLLDYCRASMGHLNQEQFRILYLNSKNMLIQDELQETGTVDHTPVYPREVVKRAILLAASAIILVHNHPSGDTKPSKADIEVTKKIQEALSTISVSIHDHLIISSKSHFSFKSNGLL